LFAADEDRRDPGVANSGKRASANTRLWSWTVFVRGTGGGGAVLEGGETEVVRRVPERRFPESRRKAYYSHVDPRASAATGKEGLEEVGWTKGLELAKWHGGSGVLIVQPGLHKAREMPRSSLGREVEKELTGRETEPHEIIYFKFYKSQIPSLSKP